MGSGGIDGWVREDLIEKPAPKQTSTDAAMKLQQMRRVIRSSLKDPDSAKFGMFYEGAGGEICIDVNARNSFGAYTGNTPYCLGADGSIRQR